MHLMMLHAYFYVLYPGVANMTHVMNVRSDKFMADWCGVLEYGQHKLTKTL